MIKICEIKRALTAMKETIDFDDNAYFDLVRDPRFISSDNASGIHVEFIQGDVHVAMDAPCRKEADDAEE